MIYEADLLRCALLSHLESTSDVHVLHTSLDTGAGSSGGTRAHQTSVRSVSDIAAYNGAKCLADWCFDTGLAMCRIVRVASNADEVKHPGLELTCYIIL